MLFIVGILLFLLELLAVIYLFYKIFKFHTLTLKDTIVYPILVILVTIIVYELIYNWGVNEGEWRDFINSLSHAIDIVKLDVDHSFASEIENANIEKQIFVIDYYFAYLISAFALFSLSVSLVKAAIGNGFRIFINSFQSERTYVFGFNDDTKNFITSLRKEEKNKVRIVLDSSTLEKYVEEKLFLEKYGITYVLRPYSNENEIMKTLNAIIFKRDKVKYRIITFFSNESKNILFVNCAKKFLAQKNSYGGFYLDDYSTNVHKGDIVYIKINDAYKDKKINSVDIENAELLAINTEERALAIDTTKSSGNNIDIKLTFIDKKEKSSTKNKSLYNAKISIFNQKCEDELKMSIKDMNCNQINVDYTFKIIRFQKPKDILINIFSDDIQQPLIEKIISQNNYDSNCFILKKLLKGNLKESNVEDYSGGLIRTFNKYELLSYKFNKDFAFAQFIDDENINEDCTLKDCDVNLYVLGYGRVSQVLLRDILICNSFSQRIYDNDNKYKLASKRINVKVYDKNKQNEDFCLSNGFIKYNTKDFNKDKYLELPINYVDYPNDFNFNCQISNYDFFKKIYNDVKKSQNAKRKQYNFFIVSLENDSKNWSIADALSDDLDCFNEEFNKNIFFVRTKNYNFLYNNYNSKKYMFGFGVELVDNYIKESFFKRIFNKVPLNEKKSIFSYDNIVNETMLSEAKEKHLEYEIDYNENEKISPEIISICYSFIDRFMQKSNIYSILGAYSKLNLIKKVLLRNEEITKIDFYEKIIELLKDESDSLEEKNYRYDVLFDFKDKYSISKVMAFIEHERWNAFELGFGVLPMSLELVNSDLQELNKFNQKFKLLYHLCITTSDGLKNIVEIFKDRINNAENDLNYVKYDFKLMDYFKTNPKSLRFFISFDEENKIY